MPFMPGCFFQSGMSFTFSGFSGGNQPMMAKRSGYFFADSMAYSFEVGSQLPGGWTDPPETPAASISAIRSSGV